MSSTLVHCSPQARSSRPLTVPTALKTRQMPYPISRLDVSAERLWSMSPRQPANGTLKTNEGYL